MFVSVLTPYLDFGSRSHSAMLRQLASLGSQQLAFIGESRHFTEVRAPWGRTVGPCVFRCPEREEFSRVEKHLLPATVFEELAARSRSMVEDCRILLTEDYPPLREALKQIFAELCRSRRVEAVLTCSNLPSLTRAAMEFDLPVIHHAPGPLRAPLYRETGLFDFSGVDGRTSAEAEMHRFAREMKAEGDFRPMPVDQIRELLSLVPRAAPRAVAAEFEAGVALQREDDLGLIAFSKGLTNIDLIFAARKGGCQVLVRRHPRGSARYLPQLGVPDDSPDSIAFLSRCETVYTLTSSLAFEALLQEKPVSVLGDSPAAGLSIQRGGAMEAETRLLCFNYLFLGYLVPAGLLYHSDYYRWRLGRPSLRAVLERHLAFYREGRWPKAMAPAVRSWASSLVNEVAEVF